MNRTEKDFLALLEKDQLLKDVFCAVSEYTTLLHEIEGVGRYIESTPTTYLDIIDSIRVNKITRKSINIVTRTFDRLVKLGLVKYIIDGDTYDLDNANDSDDEARLKHYSDLGCPQDNSIVQLTDSQSWVGCTGRDLYYAYKQKIEKAEDDKATLDILTESMNTIKKPFEDKFTTLSNEFEDKIKIVEKTAQNSLLKNTEVLSVFSAVIAIIITNVVGLTALKTLNLSGLVIVNCTAVLAIAALLILTRILVINEKLSAGQIVTYIIVITIIAALLVLAALGKLG